MFNKSWDIVFDIGTIIAMITFLLEISLNLYVDHNYLFSFYFWLDSISTITLFLDITFIHDLIFNDHE